MRTRSPKGGADARFLILAVVLSLPLLGSPSDAQRSGVHRGLMVAGNNLLVASGANWALQLDPSNQPTLIRTGGSPGWPYWGNLFGICMDWDNRTVVVPGIVDSNATTFLLFRWDPAAMAVVGTIWTGPRSRLTMYNWASLDLDSDGDFVTIDNYGPQATPSYPQAYIEFDRFAGVWNRSDLPNAYPTGGGTAGCEWDKFDGGMYHVASAPPTELWKTTVGPAGTMHRRVASHSSHVPLFTSSQVDNGDWISSVFGYFSNALYWRVPRGSSTFTSGPTDTVKAVEFLRSERFSAPGTGIWAHVQHRTASQSGIVHIDLGTGATTSLHTFTRATFPGTLAFDVLPLYDRDLFTSRTGKAAWAVSLNPGRGAFAGKPFVIGASLASNRNAVRLPDGREIFVGTDPLLIASVTGSLAPVMTGNIGLLQRDGTALARLDLSVFGAALNGTTLRFAALVLDPAAPQGIGWIAEPHALVINVLR